MPRRPNYRFERTERERKKQAKKDEKLRRQQERSASGEPSSASEIAEENSQPES
jgi:hypothetical protein